MSKNDKAIEMEERISYLVRLSILRNQYEGMKKGVTRNNKLAILSRKYRKLGMTATAREIEKEITNVTTTTNTKPRDRKRNRGVDSDVHAQATYEDSQAIQSDQVAGVRGIEDYLQGPSSKVCDTIQK